MNILRVLILILFVGLLAGCGGDTNTYQFLGYMEGDIVLVGADESGRLEKLAVKEGDQVIKGAPLFSLEASREEAALAAARAKLKQAEAALSLSRVGLKRARQLFAQGFVARSRLDDAQSSFNNNAAAVTGASADVEDALTRLARRQVFAPVAGSVQQVYFRPGEIVATGRPVVSLLPPENLKVRFYVPEPARPLMRVGETVQVSCDGCSPGLTAKISFVSGEAEYAPPVIFSRDERSKLLYLIEARSNETARNIPIGQPVTVSVSRDPVPIGS